MSSDQDKLKTLLVEQVKIRLFEEGIPRIKKCLSELSEEEVWFRPNENVVSVGNLVLHLCGNVKQWLIAGVGGLPDKRQREREFSETGPLPSQFLIEQLDDLQKDANAVLEEVSVENLLRPRTIQGVFHETGLSILVHVTEHFSYHVGQITYFTKVRKNTDLKYYGELDLGKTAD
ncbi:MAG: DinB family protein [Saprospiraceae bacterium]